LRIGLLWTIVAVHPNPAIWSYAQWVKRIAEGGAIPEWGGRTESTTPSRIGLVALDAEPLA